jgi:hypothetical protein
MTVFHSDPASPLPHPPPILIYLRLDRQSSRTPIPPASPKWSQQHRQQQQQQQGQRRPRVNLLVNAGRSSRAGFPTNRFHHCQPRHISDPPCLDRPPYINRMVIVTAIARMTRYRPQEHPFSLPLHHSMTIGFQIIIYGQRLIPVLPHQKLTTFKAATKRHLHPSL